MATARRPLARPQPRTVRMSDVRLTPEEDSLYREWFAKYQEANPELTFSAWVRSAINAQIEAQRQLHEAQKRTLKKSR